MLLSLDILSYSFYGPSYSNFNFQFASACKHLILGICKWGTEFQSWPNVTRIISRTRTPQIYQRAIFYMSSSATTFLRGHFGPQFPRASIDCTHKMLAMTSGFSVQHSLYPVKREGSFRKQSNDLSDSIKSHNFFTTTSYEERHGKVSQWLSYCYDKTP